MRFGEGRIETYKGVSSLLKDQDREGISCAFVRVLLGMQQR